MPSTYARKLAKVAEDDYNNYHGLHETTTKMSTRIKFYWSSTVGGFTSVGVAWSAVFVSAMVKSAGATGAEFKLSSRHAIFVNWAIKNADNGVGLFRAFKISDYAPKIGDIIQNNRGGNTFDYAHAKASDNYPSHSAIVVEEGVDGSGRYVRTVGGNEGDTVGDAVIRVTSAGLIKQPASDPTRYICVIQNLK
jgi:hypothetical protein